MAFVDYEKAFDSIQHRAVFEALRVHGVQEKCINIINETYTEGTVQVRTEKFSGKDLDHERSRSGWQLITSNVYSSCRGDLQEDEHQGRYQHQWSKTE